MAHYIDTSASSYVPLSAEPKTDRDGTQKSSRDGVPQWTVNVLHTPATGKPEVIAVTVASPTPIVLSALQPVLWTAMRVDFWQSGDSAGLWFAADSVNPAPTSRRSE